VIKVNGSRGTRGTNSIGSYCKIRHPDSSGIVGTYKIRSDLFTWVHMKIPEMNGSTRVYQRRERVCLCFVTPTSRDMPCLCACILWLGISKMNPVPAWTKNFSGVVPINLFFTNITFFILLR
jgi:hypothetical protein